MCTAVGYRVVLGLLDDGAVGRAIQVEVDDEYIWVVGYLLQCNLVNVEVNLVVTAVQYRWNAA